MAIVERDVVLQGRTADGNETVDLPITALRNIEASAEIKENPTGEDFIPVVDAADNGQMKKMPYSAIEQQFTQLQELINGVAGFVIYKGYVGVERNFTNDEERTRMTHVDFPEGTFTQTPTILLTPITKQPNRFLASLDGRSKDGFDLYLYNGGDSASGVTNVYFLAVGR